MCIKMFTLHGICDGVRWTNPLPPYFAHSVSQLFITNLLSIHRQGTYSGNASILKSFLLFFTISASLLLFLHSHTHLIVQAALHQLVGRKQNTLAHKDFFKKPSKFFPLLVF